jgi:hypothetical protein
VRLGVFLIDGRYGARTPYGGGIEREIYMGSDRAGPYCAMVGTTSYVGGTHHTTGFDLASERERFRRLRGAGVLGACAFVARYGLPSAPIDLWLRNGAHRFARLRGTAVTRPAPPAGGLSWTYGLDADESLWLRACRAGRDEACRRVLLGGDERQHVGPAAFDVEPSWHTPVTGTLLGDLEAAFGADRFARFWNGQGDVEQAFTHAFDADIETWTRDWSRGAHGMVTLGARIDVVTLLLSVLTVLGFTAIAALVAAHRRIG